MLRAFTSSVTSDRVSIAEIVAALGGRGLGVLIALFSLPNTISTPILFSNVLVAIPVLIFAVQLMLGFDRLMLPSVVARQTISTDMLKTVAPRVAAVLSWFERLLRPRFPAIAGSHMDQALGMLSIVLALASMAPIPFGHNLPALGLVMIGLGMIERDGLAILLGAVAGILGVVLLSLMVLGLAHGVGFLIHVF
jgi:hypothetical protein